MTRIALLTLTALAITSVSATPSSAQVPTLAPPRTEVLSALFGDMSPDADLRVVTASGGVAEGRLLSVRNDGFTVSATDSVRDVTFRDVRTVEIQGSHALQGTVWGAAGGALAGGFFGTMIGSFACSTPTGCQDDERSGALLWGTVMAVVGGGIGFYVGGHQVHWHPVFP